MIDVIIMFVFTAFVMTAAYFVGGWLKNLSVRMEETMVKELSKEDDDYIRCLEIASSKNPQRSIYRMGVFLQNALFQNFLFFASMFVYMFGVGF